jgi:hypothetical protein
VQKVPRERQTLLFSATLPPAIRTLAQQWLTEPVDVRVTPATVTVDTIRQSVFFVDQKQKLQLLTHWLRETPWTRTLVFTRTKHGADKVAKSLIKAGIQEGATLVTGGPDRPEGLDKGYYVKPTVFANVTNDMTIAKEEIFGPVVSILGYDTVDQAVTIGNDTEYGLAAYVQGTDLAKVRDVASRLRAGQVAINGSGDMSAPFGGYKMSGNGREWGDYGFHEYLETKAVLGYEPPKQAAE